MKVVYVTWDGPTTNYLEGLFFPLFHQLKRFGISTHVVQFSWDLDSFRHRTARTAAEFGVGYEVHAVPRSPLHLATGAAMTMGAALLARATANVSADLVVPRSHIPAGIALSARALRRTELVWDSDGLMPDERADFGGWSRSGLTYRAFMQLERAIIRASRRTLTRTTAAAELLAARAGVELDRFIATPNGKDTRLFAPSDEAHRQRTRLSLGVAPAAPLLVHVGSLGPQYHPTELLSFFREVKVLRHDSRLLLLTGATERARAMVVEAGLAEESVLIQSVSQAEVARILPACDAGIAFRMPSLSQRGVAPLKVAEYLLCGLPLITNPGIGDVDAQLAGSPAARFARDFGPETLRRLAHEFVDDLLPRRLELEEPARSIGARWYSLDAVAVAYGKAFGVTAR